MFNFTSGDLITFQYSLSNPKKKRLLYVTGDHIINNTQGWVEGYELDKVTGNREFKRFTASGITKVKKLPVAQLPLEANNFAEPIFAKMLGCKEEDVYTYDLDNKLIGTYEVVPEIIGRVYTEGVGHAIELNKVKLVVKFGKVYLNNGTVPLTAEGLIKYLGDLL